ncbi:MAG: sigma-54 dependent transcriptional regulator [Desulfobacula sp.]|nr:sigma-54 dependent transcriptional regulator [Desulfobacula sp.]
MNANILIIDDDEGVIYTLSRLITDMGHEVDHAFTIKDGLSKVFASTFDLILLDVNLPDGSGLDIINDILCDSDHVQIIIMTAFSDPDGAGLAIESGAWDYIEKPASPQKFNLQISRALQFQEQKKLSANLVPLSAKNIMGKSKAITRCLEQAAQMARSDTNVLITGETGTGKELFAKIIHDKSTRGNDNFIVVDCSILTENFIESVLFGHEKGAFTGADKKRNGLVSLANNGTLFLDEVGELPQSIQSSFLRVLQEKKFRPVGSEQEISSNFRVIAATNKDLDQMVNEKKFRNDLLHRLKSFTIELPALRDIKEDIKEIALFHIKQFCNQYKVELKEPASDFFEMLVKHNWPGNTRELVNTMEICVSSNPFEKILFAYHLPQKIRAEIARSSLNRPKSDQFTESNDLPKSNRAYTLKDVLKNTEKNYLEKFYSQVSGDIVKLCRISGLSRSVLYRKLKKYHIKSD